MLVPRARRTLVMCLFYLFSVAGKKRYVSMISSANITHTNSKSSWNDIQTVAGDAAVYNSLKRYFKDMAPDKNRRNYFRQTRSGLSELYFFPRAQRPDQDHQVPGDDDARQRSTQGLGVLDGGQQVLGLHAGSAGG